MNYRTPADDRYARDPVFTTLVDILYTLLDQAENKFTPTELREAVMLAATKYEYLHVRPLFFTANGLEPLPSNSNESRLRFYGGKDHV